MSLTNSNARITVDCLNELFALMANNPVRVNLRCAFGVQRNHLEFPEICLTNVKVLWTYIVDVGHIVLVKVILAGITTTITWKKNPENNVVRVHLGFRIVTAGSFKVRRLLILHTIRVQLVRIESEPAVVLVIRNTIVIIIMITSVSFSVFVMVSLVGVRYVRTVVQIVLVSILINVLVAVTLVSYAVVIRVDLKQY